MRKLFHQYMRVQQLRRWHISELEKNQETLYYGQLPIIEFINDHPDCNQSDISNFFAVSRPAIAKSIGRMERCGFIKREISLKKQRLIVTEKGNQLARLCRKNFDDIDALTLKGFTEEEIEKLNEYISRMQENLETDYTRGERTFNLFKERSK